MTDYDVTLLTPEERDAEPVPTFLAEIEAVCRRHGLVIAHEDTGGAFVIRRFSERGIRWLNDASIDLTPIPPDPVFTSAIGEPQLAEWVECKMCMRETLHKVDEPNDAKICCVCGSLWGVAHRSSMRGQPQ